MTSQCILCGVVVEDIFIDDVRDLEYGADWKGTLGKCRSCQLVQQVPMLSVSEALSYYPEEYVHYTPTLTGLRTKLMHLYLKPIFKLFTENGVKRGQKLLDIGCGGGLKASILRDRFGLEVTGLEPNPSAAEHARSEFGLHVVNSTVPTNEIEPDSFDFILISHVIEHLPDPVAFLNHLNKYLKPGGCLIGETENIGCASFRLFGRYWSFLHVPYHLLFFTQESLRETFAKSDFRGVTMSTATDPMAWSLSVQNFIRRNRKPGEHYNARIPGYLLLSLACVPLSWVEATSGPVLRFTATR